MGDISGGGIHERGVLGRVHAWQGDVCGGSIHCGVVHGRGCGACMVDGCRGMHDRKACIAGGMCGEGVHAGETTIEMGGTHHIGMHSYLIYSCWEGF